MNVVSSAAASLRSIVRNGKLLWQTFTIEQQPRPYKKTENGTQLYGPAGGSVWSAPTLDPKRHLLYVGTGNSYTEVPTSRTDAILALDMSTGAVRWANQLHAKDNYVVGCDSPDTAGKGKCPQTLGPDVDFGTSPILRALPNGHRVLLTGEKSGQVYGLDPGPAANCGPRRPVLAAASVASSGAVPRTRRCCMPLFPMPRQRLPSLGDWSHFGSTMANRCGAPIRPRPCAVGVLETASRPNLRPSRPCREWCFPVLRMVIYAPTPVATVM